MNTTEKWNSIVSNVKTKWSSAERDVQALWENIFADSAFFNYSRMSKEVDSQRSITIGARERAIPDIIIRDNVNNVDLFLVELKQHNLPFDMRFKEQLFSYLRQLRLKVGILVCERIYLYYLDFADNEISMEIPFVSNLAEGAKFVELFGKGNFDESKVEDFIKVHNAKKQRIANLRQEIKSLPIEELLIGYFSSSYSEDEIKKAISELNLPTCLPQNNLANVRPLTAHDSLVTPAVIPTKVKHSYNDDFTFTDTKDKIDGVVGYKAYNSAKENVGIIFKDTDKRLKSYECCALHMHPSFRAKYGTWHTIKNHGQYVKWDDFCAQMTANREVTLHID